MLTRIRNAAAVEKPEVRVPYSKLKHAIAKILSTEGYVGGIEKTDTGHGELVIQLKYEGHDSAIRSLARVSKPGRRNYVGCLELPRVLSDRGIAIVSTSQGVMTNKEARKRKLGGEIICEVY
jgi:small subunit ribosomal protein S8